MIEIGLTDQQIGEIEGLRPVSFDGTRNRVGIGDLEFGRFENGFQPVMDFNSRKFEHSLGHRYKLRQDDIIYENMPMFPYGALRARRLIGIIVQLEQAQKNVRIDADHFYVLPPLLPNFSAMSAAIDSSISVCVRDFPRVGNFNSSNRSNMLRRCLGLIVPWSGAVTSNAI